MRRKYNTARAMREMPATEEMAIAEIDTALTLPLFNTWCSTATGIISQLCSTALLGGRESLGCVVTRVVVGAGVGGVLVIKGGQQYDTSMSYNEHASDSDLNCVAPSIKSPHVAKLPSYGGT